MEASPPGIPEGVYEEIGEATGGELRNGSGGPYRVRFPANNRGPGSEVIPGHIYASVTERFGVRQPNPKAAQIGRTQVASVNNGSRKEKRFVKKHEKESAAIKFVRSSGSGRHQVLAMSDNSISMPGSENQTIGNGDPEMTRKDGRTRREMGNENRHNTRRDSYEYGFVMITDKISDNVISHHHPVTLITDNTHSVVDRDRPDVISNGNAVMVDPGEPTLEGEELDHRGEGQVSQTYHVEHDGYDDPMASSSSVGRAITTAARDPAGSRTSCHNNTSSSSDLRPTPARPRRRSKEHQHPQYNGIIKPGGKSRQSTSESQPLVGILRNANKTRQRTNVITEAPPQTKARRPTSTTGGSSQTEGAASNGSVDFLQPNRHHPLLQSAGIHSNSGGGRANSSTSRSSHSSSRHSTRSERTTAVPDPLVLPEQLVTTVGPDVKLGGHEEALSVIPNGEGIISSNDNSRSPTGVTIKSRQVANREKSALSLNQTFWQEGAWTEGFPDEALSMEQADISPGFAIRKIALLFEAQKYGECTALVRKLSQITLKTILPELPIELLVDAIPQSIPILDALYSRFYNSKTDPAAFPSQYLLPDKVVSQLIRWIATLSDDPTQRQQKQRNNSDKTGGRTYYMNYESVAPYSQSILRTIAMVNPQVHKKLRERQKGLLDSVQSLGGHGLVDTSESRLMNLHDALRIEFNKMIQQLKGAVVRLETVNFSSSHSQRIPLKGTLIAARAHVAGGGSSSGGGATQPHQNVSASAHQRLLQLSHSEVQERLIKNKSLLNVVEPAMSNSYLAGLLQTLEARIDADKMILFHFAELRRDMVITTGSGDGHHHHHHHHHHEALMAQHGDAVVSAVFQQYAHAYSRVIDVITAQVAAAAAAASDVATSSINRVELGTDHDNWTDNGGATVADRTSSNHGNANGEEEYTRGVGDGLSKKDSLSSSQNSATSAGNNPGATGRESQPRPGIVSRQKASFSSSSSTTTTTNGLMSYHRGGGGVIGKNTNLAASTTHLPSATSTLADQSATKKSFSASTQSLALPNSNQRHHNLHNHHSNISGSTQSLQMALPINGHNSILEEGTLEESSVDKKEVETLKSEVVLLRKELKRCRETISKMQERERLMKDRLSEHALKNVEAGSKFENLNLGDNRPTQLIRRYGNLYSQTRVDAFDALDDLPEMAEFDDLKGKLLFSVVVLAFRSVQHSVRQLRARVRHMLYLPDPRSSRGSNPEPIAREMEDTITVYLKKTVDKYDLSTNIKEVSQQVWATLFDYPSLKSCGALKAYIDECVTLAWAATVQVPALTITYECRIFDPDLHTRFHSSNPDTDQIKSVLWPALVEADSGCCMHKAVVIT